MEKIKDDDLNEFMRIINTQEVAGLLSKNNDFDFHRSFLTALLKLPDLRKFVVKIARNNITAHFLWPIMTGCK